MSQANVLQTLKETQEFVTFSDYLLHQNPPLEEWYRLYEFENVQRSVPLYGEVQKVFLTKFANEWMNMDESSPLSLQPYQYGSIHELHVYYDEKRVGIIDIKRKEVTLFECKELLTFHKKAFIEQYVHSEKYYLNRIHRKKQASSWLSKLKERISRNEHEDETLEELIETYEEIKEGKQKKPDYWDELKVQFELSERFLEQAEKQGFSVYKENDVDSCQLYSVYNSGPEHETYLNTITHYRYVDLFGMKNIYGGHQRQVMLPKSEYLYHQHRDHMQHHLHIPHRFLESFPSHPHIELIYVNFSHDDVENNTREKKYEAEINEKIKRKQSVYLESDLSISRITFRYKGFVYLLRWDGLIISSKEGIQLLFQESSVK